MVVSSARAPCAHFHLERPGLALIARGFADPAERLRGDLDKAPFADDAADRIAQLFDVIAGGAADLLQREWPRRLEIGDVPGVERRVVPAEGRTIEPPRLVGLAGAHCA